MNEEKKLVLALPKGRILKEVMPILNSAGIVVEKDFDNIDSRALRFTTSDPNLDIIRVRPFDVATFVAFGAADFGICGNDVSMGFVYTALYSPLDFGVG